MGRDRAPDWDELQPIAFHGAAGVARIVASVEEAIGTAEFPDGIPSVRASFAWAVAPADARNSTELLECADHRLLDRKRLNRV